MSEAASLQLEQTLVPAVRPRARLMFAGVIYVLSWLLGLPTLLLIEALAAWLQSPWLAAVLGPLVYGFSWLLLAASLLLGGREIASLTRTLLRRLARTLRPGSVPVSS